MEENLEGLTYWDIYVSIWQRNSEQIVNYRKYRKSNVTQPILLDLCIELMRLAWCFFHSKTEEALSLDISLKMTIIVTIVQDRACMGTWSVKRQWWSDVSWIYGTRKRTLVRWNLNPYSTFIFLKIEKLSGAGFANGKCKIYYQFLYKHL